MYILAYISTFFAKTLNSIVNEITRSNLSETTGETLSYQEVENLLVISKEING